MDEHLPIHSFPHLHGFPIDIAPPQYDSSYGPMVPITAVFPPIPNPCSSLPWNNPSRSSEVRSHDAFGNDGDGFPFSWLLSTNRSAKIYTRVKTARRRWKRWHFSQKSKFVASTFRDTYRPLDEALVIYLPQPGANDLSCWSSLSLQSGPNCRYILLVGWNGRGWTEWQWRPH